ncbi:DNA-binding protein, partial [Streptomyces brasiliscabiei]
YFEGVGAEVMGAGMFGIHSFPDDPDWRGWWGEEPPFRVPVLVLTHRERPPIVFENGTRFEFVQTGIEDAVRQAAELAGSADVRVGGGVSTVRSA